MATPTLYEKSIDPRSPEPEGIGDYGYGAEAHCSGCDHRAQEEVNEWIEYPGGNGNP